jgi:formylglycine-generating enzyme required for sulfatase activity
MTYPKLLAVLLLFFALQGNGQKFKPAILNAKTIDKKLARVSDSLYAYKYETTNGEYNIFLSELKKTDPSLYDKCIVDSANWPLRYGEPMRIYYHRHPAYTHYPVLNITYESAQEYCRWLTHLYNNDIKREFQKVQFVLPTEEQWMRAAEAGRSQAIFPWGNYYLRNKNGQFMCNFKHINEASVYRDKNGQPAIADTAAFSMAITGGLNETVYYTANVHSYYPNDFGIYNMCGNVAEMILEKGLTKGGSWNSYGGEIAIRNIGKYSGASPETGFRVFMRVIEK